MTRERTQVPARGAVNDPMHFDVTDAASAEDAAFLRHALRATEVGEISADEFVHCCRALAIALDGPLRA